MDTPFEAYVTNLGKYNEGRLVGEFLKFPTTTEEVQALLKRIGIDGVRYEEIFITDYEVNISGLYDCLGEYESIDELNYLASLISEMDQSDREKFEAVIDSGEYSGSVKELINLTQNLDCFEFYAGVEDDETLGRIYVEDMEAIDVPEHLLNYFDYEAYGRDIRINDDGHYAEKLYHAKGGRVRDCCHLCRNPKHGHFRPFETNPAGVVCQQLPQVRLGRHPCDAPRAEV